MIIGRKDKRIRKLEFELSKSSFMVAKKIQIRAKVKERNLDKK